METNNQSTALLIMDMQKGILKNYPSFPTKLEPVKKAIGYARKQNIPVIYVRLALRPGLPEINSNNKMLAGVRDRLGNQSIEEWMQIEETIVPMENEII